MKKVVIILVLIIGIIAGVGVGSTLSKTLQNSTGKQVLSSQTNQTIKKQNNINKVTPGIPKIIKIPTIGVSALVESVGMDATGNMDVPKKAENTAWYNLGFRPGQKGNAVFAGHYDKVDGSPAIFWNIAKLKIGDKIMSIDDKGKSRTFSITKIAKYPYDKFPLEEVFGVSSDSMLNLITCHGQWNANTKNYSERMVVYSKLVE